MEKLIEVIFYLVLAALCFWGANKLSLFSDKLEGVKTDVTFEEFCQISKVITVRSEMGETHATNDNGTKIRIPCYAFEELISQAARYNLYPTTCESQTLFKDGILTLVKKAA
jgi:hypothetical protein